LEQLILLKSTTCTKRQFHRAVSTHDLFAFALAEFTFGFGSRAFDVAATASVFYPSGHGTWFCAVVWLLVHRLPDCSTGMAADSMNAARRTPLIASVPKMLFPFLVILPGYDSSEQRVRL
jgi:hypothetical protein